MIRILHLIDTDKACGPGRTVLESARALQNTNYNITIAAFNINKNMDNPYLGEVQACGLQQVLIPTRHQADLIAIEKLRNTIEKHRIDILHTHGYKSDLFGYFAAKGKQVKLVSTAHGWIQNSIKAKLYVRIDKLILRYYDRVIAVSEQIKNDLINAGVLEYKIIKVHNAINLNQYSQEYGNPVLRNEYGISNHCTIIGTIGRLSSEKGQIVFLNAANIILSKYPDSIFVIIGEGPDMNHLKKHAIRLGIGKKVIFTGHRRDMIDIYHDLDIVIIPSFTEGLPNVGLEALAMKKSIVATNVGGIPEFIENEKTGILVKPGHPEEIAEAVSWLLINTEKAKIIVENGRKLIEQKYSFVQRIKGVTEIYNGIFCSKNKTDS